MKSDLLIEKNDFIEERFAEMNTRYKGFGKDLYLKIKDELPEVFEGLKFYQRIKHQIEDSYAIFNDKTTPFAIQLDPLCEVIVLWNHTLQIEIGIVPSILRTSKVDF
ncbi:hypothetical protein FUAX_50930 (plasmid) [Fulvitalea axinellae]|uniref:Uncharacterized protein n=1 Tax=Fulvitalea axinellae TaxID=1182444 RepID=A0AAU9CUG1_9BACT|nr:hypothetical protein FUAX_50930 [Fulvitalea axinellae]